MERYCLIYVCKSVTGTIRTIREGSFRGPQLFNSLPPNIRGLTQCTVNTFKHKLDEYLKNIPDTPKNTGIYNTNGHKLHHIYAEFPGKLRNTVESPTWPERLLSNFELELEHFIIFKNLHLINLSWVDILFDFWFPSINNLIYHSVSHQKEHEYNPNL